VTPVAEDKSYEAGAAGLARIARVLDEHIDEPRHAAGRERLLSALSKRSRRATRSLPWLAAAAALAITLGVILERRPARLQYHVAGAAVADGPWLGVAPSGAALPVNFSDGTEVDFGPGSQGRVAEVTADGARIVLGAGVLQARVVHRPRARWAVAAGPYTIEVTGTAFDVGWRAAGEELELSLHDGSVVVRGPSLPDGLRVAAGQRLVAHAGTGEAQLSPLLAPQPDSSSGAPVAAPSTSPSRAALETGPAPPAPPPPPTWSEMLADGNFRGVIDAAEARGIDTTLSQGSRADVVALADAARYLHDRALAKRGLLAERSRFARSAEARAAAFVLGSMADDGGARDEAIRWYDTYLTESPSGSFAAEALGRKLVAIVASGDTARAAQVAREYLRRFPRGAHAGYARDHLSAEP
jgi:FecR-like protein